MRLCEVTRGLELGRREEGSEFNEIGVAQNECSDRVETLYVLGRWVSKARLMLRVRWTDGEGSALAGPWR